MANAHAHMHPSDGLVASVIAAGVYFIRDQYEYSDLALMTLTTRQTDGTDGDVTTDDANPTGAASGLTAKQMTFIIHYSTAKTFDRAKFVPWFTDTMLYSLSYNNDVTPTGSSVWTPFTGSTAIYGTGSGTYAAGSGQLTQLTNSVSARNIRLAIQDTVGIASSALKVGSSDLRGFNGVSEVTVS